MSQDLWDQEYVYSSQTLTPSRRDRLSYPISLTHSGPRGCMNSTTNALKRIINLAFEHHFKLTQLSMNQPAIFINPIKVLNSGESHW